MNLIKNSLDFFFIMKQFFNHKTAEEYNNAEEYSSK